MPDDTAHARLTDEQTELAELLELLDRTRPGWHADAACREAPPDVTWFPARGGRAGPAQAFCARCLVHDECRAWALEQDQLAGIWAGEDAAQLRRHDPSEVTA